MNKNKKPILLGGINNKKWGKSIPTGNRVYYEKGIAVTITANGGRWWMLFVISDRG